MGGRRGASRVGNKKKVVKLIETQQTLIRRRSVSSSVKNMATASASFQKMPLHGPSSRARSRSSSVDWSCELNLLGGKRKTLGRRARAPGKAREKTSWPQSGTIYNNLDYGLLFLQVLVEIIVLHCKRETQSLTECSLSLIYWQEKWNFLHVGDQTEHRVFGQYAYETAKW